MSRSFTHLHVHTEYSILDGASRVGDIAAAAARDGQPALAMTDHGNMYGVLDFYKACNDAGVKPIIGIEAYMAHNHRSERPSRRGRVDDTGGNTESGQKLYYHLTLLAENQTGYKNLIQLSSRAFLEGYYYKPRLDWDLLSEHSEGVIATTGCLGGHVLQSLMAGDIDGATRKAGKLQDIFGRDSLFVELQDHGIAEQKRTNPLLLDIAKHIGAPVVCTNDSHYTHAHEHGSHDALLCVQTASLIADTNRFRFESDQHYLKTAQEMRYLFREVPDACDNTLWIAERCNLEIEFGESKLPNFPLPEGFCSDEDFLQHLTLQGAKKRWGERLSEEVSDRLAFELKVISDMGFASYFLITADLVDFARAEGIRVGPGRGSAAGCAVSYCLGITDIDPIKYDLLFERFLNPGRKEMPDIDMDFETRHRDAMIRYAAEKYGRENVAQIITFSTIKARNAVRDAARVLGQPPAVGDKIAKLMPPLKMGRDTPLSACLEEHPKYEDGYKQAKELRELYKSDETVKEVIDVAKGLEGLRRSDGIHAAAVVITDEPLTEYLPIQRKPETGKPIEEVPVVTQFEMGPVEALGLLKMDFLGLRNLDVISDTLAMIKETRGIEVDIDSVDLEDQATYELLQRGETIGVFQLESTGMRDLMKRLAPTCFDDVAALVALYRPGPMDQNVHLEFADRKNGRKKIVPLHKDATEILQGTYGLMIYQESMMRIAQKFAGYNLAQADSLRKACGKKIREVMAEEKDKFVTGCVTTGYGKNVGEQWWAQIEPFADYAFNKSHSYGYGFVSFQIAYLKTHFPVEYMASLLTSVKSDLTKAALYLHECARMGIEVTVPDINLARRDFQPADYDENGVPHRIVFGMSAVRGVGNDVVDLIVKERDASGDFDSFSSFCTRVDRLALKKNVVQALIYAGAFDSLGHTRHGLTECFETIIDIANRKRADREKGIMSLFDALPSADEGFDYPKIPDTEFEQKERLSKEKEKLGLYVSDHPLKGLADTIAEQSEVTMSDIAEKKDGDFIMSLGILNSVTKRYTRKQDLMAILAFEDLTGIGEVVVFPKTMKQYGHLLQEDEVVLMKGRVQVKDESHSVIGVEFSSVEGPVFLNALELAIEADLCTEDVLLKMHEIVSRHDGKSRVIIEVEEQKIVLSEAFSVDRNPQLVGELRRLLGSKVISA